MKFINIVPSVVPSRDGSPKFSVTFPIEDQDELKDCIHVWSGLEKCTPAKAMVVPLFMPEDEFRKFNKTEGTYWKLSTVKSMLEKNELYRVAKNTNSQKETRGFKLWDNYKLQKIETLNEKEEHKFSPGK